MTAISAESYPRVLFLTPCAFNGITGGGVTFTNLFRGWPRDRLATVTDDPVPVSREVCERYYFLTDQELCYEAPFHWLRRRTAGPTGAAGPRRSVSPWQHWAKRLLGDAGLPDRGQLSPALREWLAEFRPEVIYSILGSPGYFDLLDAMARSCRAPFVIHVMDNGTIDPRRTGLFRHHLRESCARRLRRLLPRAAARLAIGEMMAAEYAQRYGRPFLHFQNAIDLDRWQGHGKRDLRCGQPARLVYVGAILPYAVLGSLRDCCRAVCALNQAGLHVRLEIYTPLALFGPQAATLPVNPAIHVADVPADDERFFALLQGADALLLPVNFDPASVHFIRLSMPTKVPSYLASGVPILVYGPAHVAQVAYASRHGWGHVVDQRSPALLEQGIRAILTNTRLRAELVKRARETARRFHDAPAVRAAFQQVLIEAGQMRNGQPTVVPHRRAS
jgi:glycosyltransferase involved in cell wall biosynthesis